MLTKTNLKREGEAYIVKDRVLCTNYSHWQRKGTFNDFVVCANVKNKLH